MLSSQLLKNEVLFNLPEEKIDEQFISGNSYIPTGKAIGKINGLAILDRGYYSFGGLY
jgi:hypothetical protein